MKLDVAVVERAAPDVSVFTFRHPRRPSLPPATPGAHVDLHLPDGRIRQYSLCGDPADSSVYRVAIKREDAGRGGSRLIHDTVVAGAVMPVSAPRNHFPLAADASHHILIGGGIGITPLIAMAHQLKRTNESFELHYCARGLSPPLLGELRALCGEHLRFYPGAAYGERLDPLALLSRPRADVHVYCCGPQSLMQALQRATAEWPEQCIHAETFKPLIDENFVPEAFEIELASTGKIVRVPPEMSALQALREHGVALPSSCEIGVCGSCECGYRAGEAIHRDVILSRPSRRDRFMPCVSRARGRIVLDL